MKASLRTKNKINYYWTTAALCKAKFLAANPRAKKNIDLRKLPLHSEQPEKLKNKISFDISIHIIATEVQLLLTKISLVRASQYRTKMHWLRVSNIQANTAPSIKDQICITTFHQTHFRETSGWNYMPSLLNKSVEREPDVFK